MNHSVLRLTSLAVLLLAACGGGGSGGGVTGSVTVTPLNGVWTNSGNGSDRIQFVSPLPKIALFSSRVDVIVNLFQEIEPCPGTTNLVGTLDNGKLTLYPAGSPRGVACLVGTFTSLVALDAAAPDGQFRRTYLNDRVDVGMACGLWVGDGGRFKFKFREPQSLPNGGTLPAKGDDVSASAIGEPFSGAMTGVTASAQPTASGFTFDNVSTAFPFVQMVFVDGARMEAVDAAGKTFTLQRQPDPPEATCTF